MCLSAVKNQLTKIIYPFVEASSDMMTQLPSLLLHVIQSPADSDERRLISEIFHSISSVIPRINDLIAADSMSMSEAIVIQAVYVAIGPFFVVEGGTDSKGKEKKSSALSATLGTSAMRGLRLEALGLICSVSNFVHWTHAKLILRTRRFSQITRNREDGSLKRSCRRLSSFLIPNKRLGSSGTSRLVTSGVILRVYFTGFEMDVPYVPFPPC